MTYVKISILFLLTLWVSVNCYWQLHQTLQFAESTPHQIIGVINSLPENENHHTVFTMQLSSLDQKNISAAIKLNWYGSRPLLDIGQRWQLNVKLKHPNSIRLEQGFDYGKWLMLHGFTATGYVINKLAQQKLANHDDAFFDKLDRFRSDVDIKIHQTLNHSAYQAEAGLISALTVGIRSAMQKDQWQDFQNTGTVHLMAIAGLHIGFCSGWILLIASWLWSRSARLCLHIPAQTLGLIAALGTAFCYAMLAGFALPTQRAFIMIAVMVLAKLCNRNISLLQGLFLALVIILILEPTAILTASFWLTFSAVGLIFYGLHGRVNHHKSHWRQLGQMQWLLSIGLTPITLWFFQQASLSSILANLIAIPVVTIFVIPLAFLGCLLLPIDALAAHALLFAAAFVLHYLMWFLHLLAFLPHSVWYFTLSSFLELFAMVLAFLILLAPKGMRIQSLGLVLLIGVLLC